MPVYSNTVGKAFYNQMICTKYIRVGAFSSNLCYNLDALLSYAKRANLDELVSTAIACKISKIPFILKENQRALTAVAILPQTA